MTLFGARRLGLGGFLDRFRRRNQGSSPTAAIRAARQAGFRGSNDALRGQANLAFGRTPTQRQRAALGRRITNVDISSPGVRVDVSSGSFQLRSAEIGFGRGPSTLEISFTIAYRYDYLFLEHQQDLYAIDVPTDFVRQRFVVRFVGDGGELERVITQVINNESRQAIRADLRDEFGQSQADFHMDFRLREVIVRDVRVVADVRT